MVPYAKRMEKMAFTANVVKGLFGSMTNPDIISFSGGSPAREALPVDTIRQLADEVLRTDTRGVEALQYGPIEGIRDLREVVVRELLAPKGIDCGVDNVIIITGGLEGINLACQAYIDPGDVILVEAPTFVQSVEIFDMFEARCVGVAMDDDGLIPEDLERKIRQCHPKMIYVIPTFQNPSGRTLSLERRKAVAELAAKYDVLVLEDDPYGALRISGEDVPPIKHFDETGAVVYAGSFSKILCPGMRLAYCAGQPEFITKMVTAKQGSDVHTNVWAQRVCERMLRETDMNAHIARLQAIYREKANHMMAQLDEKLSGAVSYVRPEGGMFIWAKLPDEVPAGEFARRCLEKKLAVVPGSAFYTDSAVDQPFVRLNFSTPTKEQIDRGVAVMAEVLAEMTK